jgi:two-component system cell cycle response regulator
MKVLHLEQSSLFKKIIHEIMLQKGLDCIQTGDTDEALSILKEQDIDLILMSLELGAGRSEKFIKEVNASEFRKVPIIAVTSTDSIESRQKFFSLGIADYILKSDLNYNSFNRYISGFFQDDRLTEELKKTEIAVLDDSEMELKVIGNIFRLHGIKNVDFYSDPKEFLTSHKAYSLYVIDIVLPGISGEEVIQKIHSRNPEGVILGVSSITNFKTISHILSAGAYDYVLKPFDPNLFMLRLKNSLRLSKLARVLREKEIGGGEIDYLLN